MILWAGVMQVLLVEWRLARHTESMGIFNRFRLGPLLALVVVLLVVSFGAWGQDNTDTYAFPYLGPDKVQARMLEGAYVAQSSLFGAAVNGKDMPTLRFLGVFAVLIGSLLVVFNAKYRNATTILTWLLLVVVVIFSPFGSKLLFYRVNHVEGKFAGLQSTQSLSGDCKENPRGCGFTPQLAAIHLASTMQIIVSDMFRSSGWTDLIETMLSGQYLKSSALLTANDVWLNELMRYSGDQCGKNTLFSKIASAKAAAVVNAASNSSGSEKAPTYTFGSQWAKIAEHYDGRHDYTLSPPPMIVLYDDDKVASYGINAKAYTLGLQKIYNEFFPNNSKQIVLKGNNSNPQPNEISIKEALDQLATVNNGNFFKGSSDIFA